METGFRRNPLAELLDSVGRGALLLAMGIGWFSFLWGMNLPALLAGIALGTLLLLLWRLYRRLTLARRETALRCRIGGELLLEKMLLSEAKAAHFQAALLLGERWVLQMRRMTADGALCSQKKASGGTETLLIQCVRMMPEGELSTGQLVEAHRAMRRQNADRAVLCVLGKSPPRVIARAEQMPIPIRVVRRETLLTLAGRLAPATDEQLVALGQRKRRTAQRGSLLRIMTQRDKALRYWGYGLFMLTLFILTGSAWYAMPGTVCLTLSAVCRSGQAEEARL